MTTLNFKTISTTFIIGAFLLLCPNLNAQTKMKSKTNLTELEKFLTKQNNYVKIPITKTASGHLHIVAILNGVEGEFILDTGAGATVIENKRKEKFKLQTEEATNSGTGAGGTQSMQKSLNNNFKIGSLEKPAFNLYVMNLDHVNNALKSMGLNEVDGVIGADILTENKAIIDYSNLVLYLKK